MPINLFNNPLSSIKLGADDILKGYIGNGQIFPNNTEITAAAFNNASTGEAPTNQPYTVSGEIGSSFSLLGSVGATAPSGTQVISTSPSTYQIAIGANSACGDPARDPQVVISPVGNTVLASGLSNTDTISQVAGPIISSNPTTLTLSVTNLNYQTITVGGQVRWANGSKWALTANLSSTVNNAINRLTINSYQNYFNVSSTIDPTGNNATGTTSEGFYWSPPTWAYAPNGNYSGNLELYNYPNGLAAVSFYVQVGNVGCNVASPSTTASATLYP